jgi:hypothetical protein
MSDCGVKHQCADGRTGECNQTPGHLTRHLCGECLSFFTAETTAGVKAAPSIHPLAHSLLQMQNAASSPRAGKADWRADGEAQLFGVWKTTASTIYGQLTVELILKPDKHFSQLSKMNGLMAYDEGTIEIVEKEHFIHFEVTDHEPKQHNGVEIKWLKSWGCFYKVLDKDTMEFEDRVVKERWIVHRA